MTLAGTSGQPAREDSAGDRPEAADDRPEAAGDQPEAAGSDQRADEELEVAGEEAPAEAAPGEEAPAEDAPGQEAPAEAAPGQEAPAERAAGEAHDRWRLTVVGGVYMELPGVHPEVQLRETVAPYRELRIPVGFAEGTAIAHAWRHIATPRPLTHELVTDMLSAHTVTIEAVRITERRGQIFYAELDTMGPKGHHVVPCRPSDAIALMLRQPLPTPLLVADEVFEARDELS